MSEELSTRELRALVSRRAQGCCEYCRCPARFIPAYFAVEHIHPLSRGGPTQLDNLAFSCPGCNNQKYNKTGAADPDTGGQAPLFNPRTQRWQDHFAWSEDFTHVIGRTPSGRATVAELELNREETVNLRLLLVGARLHPPPETDAPTPLVDPPEK